MRKLLVASQKGGVGKTTTSINLAAAAATTGARVLLVDADPLSGVSSSLQLDQRPNRHVLRQNGAGLPGVLACDVLPGLDVLSPYEEGGCSDGDLDELLVLLETPAVEDGYDCLLLNTPPFLGANPGQLLDTCDEFVLVMRAEPLAYRTLPAFLELARQSRRQNPIKLRGILLTLPEGEIPGGRWERELRGRFGSRILPEVVPFDEEVGKAQVFGQTVAQASPGSPAASEYFHLTESLDLLGDVDPGRRREAASPLLAVALGRRQPVGAASAARGAVALLPDPDATEVVREAAPPPIERGKGKSGRVRRVDAPAADDLPSFEELILPSTPSKVVRTLPAAADPAPAPPASPSAAANRPGLPPIRQAALWIAVAVAIGLALRLIEFPTYAVPVVVGLAISAAVVLIFRLIQTATERAVTNPPSEEPAKRPSREVRAARRADGKSDGPTRLAMLAGRSLGAPRRRPPEQ